MNFQYEFFCRLCRTKQPIYKIRRAYSWLTGLENNVTEVLAKPGDAVCRECYKRMTNCFTEKVGGIIDRKQLRCDND